ncbi:MAG TPA: DNA-formamidopyrimidine glycosylase family protein [bacterium]|nr:DNA-formamidopyrimidine glycosylase family protein [bacterium]
MPELPEVESTARSLRRPLRGKVVASVDVRQATSVRTHTVSAFARLLTGKRIENVSRRGKTLLLTLREGWTLLVHFKLWGIVRFSRTAVGPDAQTAVVIAFTDGSRVEFRELQLSELGLHPTEDLTRVKYLASLGVEPLSRAFSKSFLRALLAGRGSIRALLTNQSCIAGIGNLWAHEILHAARIRPDRQVSTLTPGEADRLYRTIRRVLPRAITAGGEPEFVDPLGRTGRWRLAVYGRGGQPCPRRDGTIRAVRLGGRPSFYCPTCQR